MLACDNGQLSIVWWS